MKLTESDKKHGNQLGLNEAEMMLFKAFKSVKHLEKRKNYAMAYKLSVMRFQSYMEMATITGTITCNKDKDDIDRISKIMIMAEKEVNNE